MAKFDRGAMVAAETVKNFNPTSFRVENGRQYGRQRLSNGSWSPWRDLGAAGSRSGPPPKKKGGGSGGSGH